MERRRASPRARARRATRASATRDVTSGMATRARVRCGVDARARARATRASGTRRVARASAGRASTDDADAGAASGGRRAFGVGVGLVGALARVGAGGVDARAASGGVLELTPENFEREVTKNAGAVFVEFYAPWCPYCKRLEPIWDELPSKLQEAGSKTRVARMNVDTYTDYASAYAITGFPTLMLFENGRPVGAKQGLVDMATAMKYAGVKDESVIAKLQPEKKLDKILSGSQIEYVQFQLGEIRKELGGIADAESRARALAAVQQVESIVGVRSL